MPCISALSDPVGGDLSGSIRSGGNLKHFDLESKRLGVRPASGEVVSKYHLEDPCTYNNRC